MTDIRVDRDGGIARVVMARPPVNALTLAGYVSIADRFLDLEKNPEICCVILVSESPRAFCAGKDFKEFLSSQAEDYLKDAPLIRRTFETIRNCSIPTIAAVNGPALGAGCSLAAMCDIRIASDRASFTLPEINVGRCGGGAHLGRFLPAGVLRRMFFTGEPLRAPDAFRLGFVDEVTSPEDLDRTAMALARVIATKSPIGLRLGKRSLNEAEELSISEGYAREQNYSAELSKTKDSREAISATIEKRAPRYTGT